MEKAAGVALASPTPTPNRNRARVPKLLAVPERAVMKLQKNRPPEMRLLRTQTSAKRPSGMPKIA